MDPPGSRPKAEGPRTDPMGATVDEAPTTHAQVLDPLGAGPTGRASEDEERLATRVETSGAASAASILAAMSRWYGLGLFAGITLMISMDLASGRSFADILTGTRAGPTRMPLSTAPTGISRDEGEAPAAKPTPGDATAQQVLQRLEHQLGDPCRGRLIRPAYLLLDRELEGSGDKADEALEAARNALQEANRVCRRDGPR